MTAASRARLRDSVKLHEGLRLFPYTDTVGKLTIGYGRNLTDRGITEAEAAELLTADLELAELDVVSRFPWAEGLDDVRFSVLVEMSFNMGIVKLAGFQKTLAMVRKRDYDGAAIAMLQSRWAEQVGNRSLTLADRMRLGKW